MTARRCLRIILAMLVPLTIGIGGMLWWPSADRHPGRPTLTGESFPDIDRTDLAPLQARVVDIVHQQFDDQPPASTYTEGREEPWCADFISWVLNAAGAPLSNPNNGSWRIPGVYTMEAYFQSVGRLEGTDYRPQPGDIMLWGVRSPMALHANIIVAVQDDTVTTVGGDENGIRLRHTQIRPDLGLLGFGRLS